MTDTQIVGWLIVLAFCGWWLWGYTDHIVAQWLRFGPREGLLTLASHVFIVLVLAMAIAMARG